MTCGHFHSRCIDLGVRVSIGQVRHSRIGQSSQGVPTSFEKVDISTPRCSSTRAALERCAFFGQGIVSSRYTRVVYACRYVRCSRCCALQNTVAAAKTTPAIKRRRTGAEQGVHSRERSRAALHVLRLCRQRFFLSFFLQVHEISIVSLGAKKDAGGGEGKNTGHDVAAAARVRIKSESDRICAAQLT